jgi:hypothetical protein
VGTAVRMVQGHKENQHSFTARDVVAPHPHDISTPHDQFFSTHFVHQTTFASHLMELTLCGFHFVFDCEFCCALQASQSAGNPAGAAAT